MAHMTYIRGVLIAGVFALPFIPFLITESLVFPFITGKTFVFRILVEILFALYVILALAEPSYRPKRSWLLWAIGAFVLSAGIATFLSVDSVKSFWSNFERMEGYLGLLHLAGYFILASTVLTTEKLWLRFFQTSVAASALMGVYVLFQIWGIIGINQGGVRTDGTFGNATYLAVYMLFHIFFTLYLLVREKLAWIQGLYLLALILQAIALFYTATRGAAIGLVGGLLLTSLFVLFFERERRGIRKIAIGVVVGAVVVVGTLFALRNVPALETHPVLSRFTNLSFQERTIQARFVVWGMALEGFKEKPLFGWGQENFNFVFNKNYDPQMYEQEQWFDRAHNSFLDWLIAGGIVTFLAYVALFVLTLTAFLRSKLLPTEKGILVGLLAAYAFHLSFVFDNLVSAYYFFTLLAFAHFLSKNELPGSMLYAKPVRGVPLMLASGAVAAAAVVVVYAANVPGIRAAHDLLQAMTPVKAVAVSGGINQVPKTPAEHLDNFKGALSHGSLGRQESVEQLLQTGSNLSQQNVDPQIKQEFFDYAEEQGLAFLEERPNDARLELFMGAFYNQWKRYDEALMHLNRAVELSPTKQGTLFEIGFNSYLNAGNYPAAEETFKKAFELAPEFDRARIFYAISLFYQGKNAQADALLEEKFGTAIVDDSLLLNTYFSRQMYDRVIAIWQKRVEAQPTNLQLRVSLAASYIAAGNRAAAIQVLRDAIAIQPGFKAQGEQFIADIEAGRI